MQRYYRNVATGIGSPPPRVVRATTGSRLCAAASALAETLCRWCERERQRGEISTMSRRDPGDAAAPPGSAAGVGTAHLPNAPADIDALRCFVSPFAPSPDRLAAQRHDPIVAITKTAEAQS